MRARQLQSQSLPGSGAARRILLAGRVGAGGLSRALSLLLWLESFLPGARRSRQCSARGKMQAWAWFLPPNARRVWFHGRRSPRRNLMRRVASAPRAHWQQKVEEAGLMWHSAEQPYWNESAFYEFTAKEVGVLESA